jgi:hypothetical protein
LEEKVHKEEVKRSATGLWKTVTHDCAVLAEQNQDVGKIL